MIGQFLLAFKKALEASLIIAIILAYLTRTKRKTLTRNAWYGVSLAITASLVFGASSWRNGRKKSGTDARATQYFLGGFHILRELTKKIHEEGVLAILDHKLSDIGSTNESALFWISDMGFNAFTFSPFAGNIQTTVDTAHNRDLGVIVLAADLSFFS